MGMDSNPTSLGGKRSYSKKEIENLKTEDSAPACAGGSSEFSLYQAGKTLDGVKQQDQDGLSTCYANAASLIMKSYNPQLPVPSYLHLASYNIPDPGQEYDFDIGRTCSVLNRWKKENSPLCADNILENQPSEIQDNILKTLYDVYNKYEYTPDQVMKLFESYDDFLEKNPMPNRGTCQEKADQLNFDSFTENKLLSLLEESTYWSGEGFDLSLENEQFAKECAHLFQETFRSSGQILTQTHSDMDGGTYTTHSLKESLKTNEGQKFKAYLQSQKHPSNVNYFQSILQLLDSSKNYSGTYEKIIGESTSATQYTAFLDKMVREATKAVLLPGLQPYVSKDSRLQNCLEKSNFLRDSYSPLMFNSLLAQCKDTGLKQWRTDLKNNFNQCSEVDQSLISVFNSLLSLDQNVNDIKKFIASSDKNILKQIINNNCKQFHNYKLPSWNCTYKDIPPDIGATKDPNEWSIYKWFEEDLNQHMKKNGLKTMINLETYLNDLANKLDVFDASKSTKSNSQKDAYIDMIQNIYDQLPKDSSLKTYPIIKFKSLAQAYAKKMKQSQINNGTQIVEKLKYGRAVGVSTCAELFSDSSKGKFKECSGHSVAATGFKCESGRLKIELSNSWGIGCRPDQKFSDFFDCQKDQDGLTNGRAWVDFNYLSDLGLGLSSF
jgi:hypothetical protein